ncbi:AAA family ATPase [Zhouia spongiae]|uniref:AAA family ATPase n=1 Tax=Zhouia spongiae TaxID=2202721 RepID=A0ABY3YR27_9FLAO|nr:AAA family ATPase [Zhouia spongiae]UNY99951.1 AAA family ATPase [Zhouia spongiae]
MTKIKINNNFFVITGGPGVGKTTVLKELENRNYKVIPEIARELIREQNQNNGNALPWKNKELYKDLMFERSVKSFEQTGRTENKEKPVFFDRGFLDAVCYAKLIGSEISEQMESYAKKWRYHKNVFIFPPWRDIYEKDNERKQDWNEAVLTFEKMTETYKNYGYAIIEIPKMPVNERVEFILGLIEQTTPAE